MKLYIYHITLMILSLFTVNSIWGQTTVSGTWAGGALTGSYKLTDNTKLTGQITVSTSTLTIDLNGYTLDRKKEGFVAVVGEQKTLVIKDTRGGGKIINGRGDRGGCMLISGIVRFLGGEIMDCIATDGNYGATAPTKENPDQHYLTQGCGGAFFVNSGATLEMSGNAKITNCKTEDRDGTFGRGGAVWVAGTFNMSGGTISGCEATFGGGVFVHGGYKNTYAYGSDTRLGTFNMTGGTITSCHSYSDGCGIYTYGTVNLSGSPKIISNRPLKWTALEFINDIYPKVQLTGGHGGAIYAEGEQAVVTMSGGELSNNLAESGGAVMLWTGSTMTMTGGKMDGNYAMGKPSLGNGGAVYVQGATFNFNGGTLSNNTANRYGGAININQGSILNLGGNCIITGNKASHGGGISQEAGECTLTLSNSGIDINSNEAHGHQVNISAEGVHSVTDAKGNGGGLFIEKGTVTISAGKISNNRASGHGGGASLYVNRIHGRRTTVNISGGEISNNIAEYGGGIDMYANFQSLEDNNDKNDPYTGMSELTVNFQSGTLSGNKATANGAGIYVSFNETYSTAKMTVGTTSTTPEIINNQATGDGGGLGMSNNGVFDVKNANMSNNTAKNGGAIWLGSGTFTIDNGTFTSNTAVENGGGIYVGGGTFTVNKTVSMNGNVAENQAGGGIYLGEGSFTVGSNGEINLGVDGNGNSAGTNGGGIYCNAPLTVNGSTSVQNGSARNGGGLFVVGTAKFAKTTYFANNYATVNGGAVYVDKGSIEVTGTKLTLLNNHSDNDGGAFYAYGSSDRLSNIKTTECLEATITNNYSGNEGGAFYVNNGDIQLCTTNLSNNGKNGSTPSTKNGGAIALHNGIFAFGNGSVVENNAAIEHGGALYVSNQSATTITCEGGEYIANEAKLGGGIYASGPITLSFAATINSNKAWNGGGLYLDGGVTMSFGNGLIKANTANPNTQTADDGTQYGVGGGIYLAQGTLNFTKQNSLGIYNNNASYEAADIYASGKSTTINLPNVSNMNLTGFDTPGNILYWVYDFNEINEANKRYGRYEAALRNFSDDGIEKMILPFEDTEDTKEIKDEICLDLGYDLVYVTIETKGLDQSDIAALLISYKKEGQEAKQYRKVVFMGESTLLIGLPTGDFWKFDASEWAIQYNAPKIEGSIGTNKLYTIDKYNKSIKVNFTKKKNENGVDMTKTKINEYMKVNKMNPTKQTTSGTSL